MIKLIFFAAILTAFAIADEHDFSEEDRLQTPRVSNYFPKNGWEIYDFFTGLILGVYTII